METKDLIDAVERSTGSITDYNNLRADILEHLKDKLKLEKKKVVKK